MAEAVAADPELEVVVVATGGQGGREVLVGYDDVAEVTSTSREPVWCQIRMALRGACRNIVGSS